MQYSLSTLHIELSPTDYQLLEEKLARLNKFLKQPYNIDILVRHDQHHKNGNVVTCRINVEHKKHLFHTDRSDSTFQTAFDKAIDAIKKELSKNHTLDHKK